MFSLEESCHQTGRHIYSENNSEVSEIAVLRKIVKKIRRNIIRREDIRK